MYNKTVPCYKWKHTFKVLTKINTYTLFTSRDRDPAPLEYVMMGYDTLLASYYDKYVLSYTKFEPWKYDFGIFEIPSSAENFFLSNIIYNCTHVLKIMTIFHYLMNFGINSPNFSPSGYVSDSDTNLG